MFATAQPRIMPGMIGLMNSQTCRNQKLIDALLSREIVMPRLASSTIGAEKRAPPMEGSSPKKAGIVASVTLVEEKISLSESTMPRSVPDLRNSISRHITK